MQSRIEGFVYLKVREKQVNNNILSWFWTIPSWTLLGLYERMASLASLMWVVSG
jgi:hypothetical protein